MSETRPARFELVVWMNEPSHYQTSFFRALHARGVELEVIYASDLPARRRALGWQSVQTESFRQHFLRGRVDALKCAWRLRGGVHLVNGVWSVPLFVLASTLLLLVGGSDVYFHSERPAPESGRRWLIGCKRVWLAFVFQFARGIFVIGEKAGEFYRSLGVERKMILPFMYFTRVPTPASEKPSNTDILYVGQFVPRKRVEDLIEAMSAIAAQLPHARLLLVGSGPLEEVYRKKIAELGLGARVQIVGALPPDEVAQRMGQVAVVALPSAFDGWGLTVNEALQRGTPVVCSDECGAAQLLRERPDWGATHPAGDVAALRAALLRVLRSEPSLRPVASEVEAVLGVDAQTERFLRFVE